TRLIAALRALRPERREEKMVFSRLITFVAICLSGIWFSASAQSPSGAASLNIESPEIAFASHRDGNWGIYVRDSAGRSQRRLTRRAVQDRFPLWSPDGAQIAFGSQVDSGWELWVMDSNGIRERRMSERRRSCASPSV